MKNTANTIWTIGHSTRTLEEFVLILRSFNIEVLADVRRYPGSKRLPHFNQAALSCSLQQEGIDYIHLPALGGRMQQQVKKGRSSQPFQSYYEHMGSEAFAQGITALQEAARNYCTAYMCAEANWRHCHRSMISLYLFKHDWNVWHILGASRAETHPKPLPSKPAQGKLFS